MGCSIINYPFWGTPILRKFHIISIYPANISGNSPPSHAGFVPVAKTKTKPGCRSLKSSVKASDEGWAPKGRKGPTQMWFIDVYSTYNTYKNCDLGGWFFTLFKPHYNVHGLVIFGNFHLETMVLPSNIGGFLQIFSSSNSMIIAKLEDLQAETWFF